MNQSSNTKNSPVFLRTSINGMSIMAREIAAMLEEAGFIKITDAPEEARV